MRIIQITDLHIGHEGEMTFDVDVRQNFINVLERVHADKPDLLAVTGDLCFRQPELDIYAWIKGHLDNTGLPYLVISGNHDDSKMLAGAFGMDTHPETGELFFKHVYDQWQALFLDTSVGKMSSVQYKWLQNALEAHDGQSMIFMHHPPAISGVPFMDQKHAFRQMDLFQEVIQSQNKNIHVFCGHYHVGKTVALDHLQIHITPSCFFQIRQDSPEFAIDHYRIAFRVIDPREQGKLMTQLCYIPGHMRS